MSKKDKLIKRLQSKPKDFTFDEAENLLRMFGYNRLKSGKTSGSRVKFANSEKRIISLHKPHPENILKNYVIIQLIEFLDL